MRILVYASQPGHGTNRLIEEIENIRKETRKDILGEVVQATDLYSYLSESTRGHDRIYRRGAEKSEKLIGKNYQAIIPRLAGAGFEIGLMNLRHMNRNLNIFSTATDTGLRICSNKFLTCQVLSEHGLRVPKQVLAHRPTDYKELIDGLGGLPIVCKLQRGSMGAGVFILESYLSASTTLRAMEQTSYDVILSRFIDSGTPASDLRIITIGAETNKPKVIAYRRYAVDSDFRSNYSISGKGEKAQITDEEKEMALSASRILGGGVHGVDIMRDTKDNNRPFIIESNGCPGLAGVESITGENVARAIIEYTLENYNRGGNRKETTTSGATNKVITTQPQAQDESIGNRILRLQNEMRRD